jgi:hypothetical protein
MKPYHKGLLLQPTFGKAVGTSPYHHVEGDQHRVNSLASGDQQLYAVQRPDDLDAWLAMRRRTSTSHEVAP